MCEVAAVTTTCEHYDDKREPLRLEVECEIEQWIDGEDLFYVPTADGIFVKLDPFRNKRVKMTLEEIIE